MKVKPKNVMTQRSGQCGAGIHPSSSRNLNLCHQRRLEPQKEPLFPLSRLPGCVPTNKFTHMFLQKQKREVFNEKKQRAGRSPGTPADYITCSALSRLTCLSSFWPLDAFFVLPPPLRPAQTTPLCSKFSHLTHFYPPHPHPRRRSQPLKLPF